MLALPCASLALSLLCIPDTRAGSRLRTSRLERSSRGYPWRARSFRRAAIPAAGLTGYLVAGAGGVLAATAVSAVGAWYWKSRCDARSRGSRVAELVVAIRALTAELRAGAHPAAAIERAAADAGPAVAGVFGESAATARLGGDVATFLWQRAEKAGDLREPLRRLGRAWALAHRHGIALADVLDALRRDLDHRVTFARDVEARMAGPRASASVLAALPVLGLLLGEAAGAGPLTVLTGQVLGQVLLVAGAGLLCAGWLWTVRLTEGVARC